MSAGKGTVRPTRANQLEQLRHLQKAIAVARCIRLAAEYYDGDGLDIADAVAGLLVVLERVRPDVGDAP